MSIFQDIFGGGRYRPQQDDYALGQSGVMNARYDQMAGNAQTALGQYNPLAADAQAQAQQGQLANSLMGTISGQTPSVAQQQLQQTTQGNVANNFAMAAANGNNPAAARMAMMNAGNLNQQAAGQGALLRAQELQNAQGQLGGVLGGMRSQDQSLYGGLNQTAFGALQGQLGVNQAQMQGNMAFDQAKQAAFQNQQANTIGGKIMGAASGIAGAVAHMAHGGVVPQIMGDTRCPGCGHMKSDCQCDRMAQGGMVPGYAHGLDRPSNDKVPAVLSPGEVVLPRSVTKAKNAPDKARAFMDAIKKKHGAKKAA